MGWVILSIAIFAAIGLGYYWSTTAEERRVKRWKRRLSPREARRAELHAFDNEEETELITRAQREVATLRGVRRWWPGGTAVGSAGGSGSDAAGGDGGDCD